MFQAYARITSSINPIIGFTGIIFEYMLQSMPWQDDATGELPSHTHALASKFRGLHRRNYLGA